MNNLTVGGTIRRANETDAELEKRLQQKRSIDYFTPIGKYMISKNVYNRRRRHAFPIGSIRPDSSFITDLPAPLVTMPEVVDMSTRFVHVATNKTKHAIHTIKWTPDAKRILVASFGGEFTLWNGFNFSFDSIMQAHDFPIYSLEYSYNAKWLISGDQSGCIKYWQPNFNNVNIIDKGHEDCVNELSFSPNDSKFLSGSDDQTLKIWDFTTAKEERILKGHHWDVKSCDWHSSLGLVVSGSKDNLVKLWDPRDSTCITTIHDFKHTVTKTLFQKNGNERLLAACSRDRSVRVFDLRMLRPITVIRSEKDSDLTTISWHPIHSTHLTVGAYDGSLCHYNIDKTIDIELFNKPSMKNNIGTNDENDNENGDNIAEEESGDEEDEDDDVYDPSAPIHDKLVKKEEKNQKEELANNYDNFDMFNNRRVSVIHEALHVIPHAHDRAIFTIEYHPLGHMLCTAGADKSARLWSRGRPNEDSAFKDSSYEGEEWTLKIGVPTNTNSKTETITNESSSDAQTNNTDTELVPGLNTIPGLS